MSIKQERIFWPCLAVIVLGLSATVLISASGRTSNSLAAKGGDAKAALVEGTAQPTSGNVKQRIEGEIIAITPHGFEPRQITRRSGAFLLAIDNRSGFPAVTLLLNPDVGLPFPL